MPSALAVTVTVSPSGNVTRTDAPGSVRPLTVKRPLSAASLNASVGAAGAVLSTASANTVRAGALWLPDASAATTVISPATISAVDVTL
ncbi:Uncharacterised protein [Bordetella pertussis]|nr:Uncharacterised protein [Bordetella pertussis]CFW31988.1 Uncharacterised protein [Bordetella pertussis]